MIGALAESLGASWSRGLRFGGELVPRAEGPIAWNTPNRVVLEAPHFRLRSFEVAEGVADLPMLVVPPEINGSNLCDYGPDQSLVQALRAGGFGAVHAIEWKTATAATKDLDVDDSVAAILACIEHLGGRSHLLGICQGGWEAAVATALRPDAVATLCLAAAPIDFRSPDSALTRLVDATPMVAYEAMVALGGGVMRGEHLRTGFTNLRFWERRVIDRLALWNHLDDPEWMERRERMGRWYHARKDLPGRAYLRAVRELFKENRLLRGTFVVLGQPVDLARIRCPVALVAGEHDHITLPEQLFAAEGAMRAARCRRWTLPAGHVGVVIKRGLPAWSGICRWLLEGDPMPPVADC
jgi:poly(3-hydroxybutyrate) depolymerase